MKKFVNFLKISVKNRNIFIIILLVSLFFGIVPLFGESAKFENPNLLNLISLFLSSLYFPCVVMLFSRVFSASQHYLVRLLFTAIIIICGLTFCVLAVKFFWIFLIPFVTLTILAIVYSRTLNKKEAKLLKEKEEEEFRLLQIREAEKIEEEKKEKAKLTLVYASFLLDCGVILDAAQVKELNKALEDILEMRDEETSERVALVLHRISKDIPSSLQPLLASVVAQKWIRLQFPKEISIEDLYSQAINK